MIRIITTAKLERLRWKIAETVSQRNAWRERCREMELRYEVRFSSPQARSLADRAKMSAASFAAVPPTGRGGTVYTIADVWAAMPPRAKLAIQQQRWADKFIAPVAAEINAEEEATDQIEEGREDVERDPLGLGV